MEFNYLLVKSGLEGAALQMPGRMSVGKTTTIKLVMSMGAGAIVRKGIVDYLHTYYPEYSGRIIIEVLDSQ